MITKRNRYFTEHLMIDYAIREGNFSMKEKHMHSEYEIYLLLEGEGHIFINNICYPIKSGDLIFIDSQMPHATDFSSCPMHKRFVVELNVLFFEETLLSLSSISLTNFFKINTGVISLLDGDFRNIRDTLTSIYTEAKEKKENYEHMISLKLSALFILLNRITSITQASPSFCHLKKSQLLLVENAVEFILNNFNTDISLNSISECLYINKSHLSRVFKEVTGMTVHEYINVHRIRKAREYLLDSNLTLHEISRHCGFHSITYFTTTFTRHTSFSPSRYRKNHQ